MLLVWVEGWARRYEEGASIYNPTIVIDLKMETKAYQWVKLKKEVRKHPSGDFYMVPAAPSLTLNNWNETLEWETFDEYCANTVKGWSTTVSEDWMNGTCISLKLVMPRPEAKQIPLGQKRKSPQLAKKALIIQ